MAAFATVGPGWLVEDLGGECYAVYVVWSGKRLCGVASNGEMETLLEMFALQLADPEESYGDEQLKCFRGGYVVRFQIVRVGSTPRKACVSRRIDVRVESDAKGDWDVVSMQDVGPKPRARRARRGG